MIASASRIVRNVRSLPAKAKDALAARLLKSVDEPNKEELERLWIKEAEDRIRASERGEIKTVPWEEVWRKTAQRHKK